jgi:hypothetical protein
MRQDGEHRFAGRALDTPNSEPTEADTGVMGVPCQASTATTGRLVGELQAQGQEKGEDAFDKGLAITKQLKVCRFVLKIHGDGPVVAGLASGVWHGSPSGQVVVATDDPRWG